MVCTYSTFRSYCPGENKTKKRNELLTRNLTRSPYADELEHMSLKDGTQLIDRIIGSLKMTFCLTQTCLKNG